jgi:hypothetical protein
MKKIDTTNITGLQGAPFLKATHDHYKESIQDFMTDFIKAYVGSYTTNDVMVLYGCDVTVTSGAIPGTGTATLTAGAVYYNGEIYQVDANAGLSTTNPQTLIWSIATTYRAGDPIEWSDGTARELHRIDKFLLSAGTAGAGLANYNAATVKYLTSTTDLGASIVSEAATAAAATAAVAADVAAVDAKLGGLTTTVINIGDWNMDSTALVSIAHGLDVTKIRNVSVTIRHDNNLQYYTLPVYNDSAADIDAYLGASTTTDIVIFRRATGIFDSANFDSTSYNRGWITIAYEA